jgi:predicted kinase
MRQEASAVLAAGRAVILDATFMDADQRALVETLAADAGVRFAGVWLQSDPDLLRQRVAARTGDASDADLSVLEAQLANPPAPPAGWHLVTDHDFDNEARILCERLG